MNKEEFKKELQIMGIEITEEQEKKLKIYTNFLIEYNNHTNLTAIKEENAIYLKHFFDSLTILSYIKGKDKVLDIGTGAGFPGMVLAIMKEDTQFFLLDANNKKTIFLQELKEKLAIKNVEIIHARAEAYVKEHLEEFDIVTSRAVASLRILLEISLPALKIKGECIFLKANVREELEESQDTLNILNGRLKNKKEFTLPIEKSKRTILEIEHFAKTEPIYPRSFDKIQKKPLVKRK